MGACKFIRRPPRSLFHLHAGAFHNSFELRKLRLKERTRIGRRIGSGPGRNPRNQETLPQLRVCQGGIDGAVQRCHGTFRHARRARP